ncbi:MAG: hypothetical protein JXR97_06320 [Planctomycetes bacterium]|nr:hypothetical protein [Planctomycetota bacterium]
MQVSGVSSAAMQAAVAPAFKALEASTDGQAALIEKLLATTLESTVATQQMETTGQIIDTYA